MLQLRRSLIGVALLLLFTLGAGHPVQAAGLAVSDVTLEACGQNDPGNQPQLKRPAGAACWVLRGMVTNSSSRPVVDTDVFAVVVDASGEPALPNRSRVGSIGDVAPGRSPFALRLAIPAGTPGPFSVRSVKARGFSAPVRSRGSAADDRLPLELEVQG
ncbi:MAG: hypothetical protein VKI83_09050 [Synechococcaceae cyanobacterium]|nr:hypothetical protein [Synechococcaceae cyanobacterium]